MTDNFQFLTKNCLEWITDSPYVDYPRRSPIFFFSGIECYISLAIANRNGNYYFISGLHTVNRKKTLNERITVYVTKNEDGAKQVLLTTTFIGLQCDETCVFEEKLKKREDLLKYYGLLTVHYIFSTDLRNELHINRSEPNQVQSDSLDSSNIIRKAKLAAIASHDSISDEENLSTDFGKLLELQSTSDVTVTCGNRTFSAHRIILAARSEVFAAMFENKMIESETGSIDIKDIDGEIFELLLKYVYTGKIPEISVDIVSSLYIAADKYSIHSLKNKCSKWMLGNVTKENCLEFLFVADTWNDAKLKDGLVNFVAEILLLFEGDEWQKFSDKYPKLANSVYQKRVLTKKV